MTDRQAAKDLQVSTFGGGVGGVRVIERPRVVRLRDLHPAAREAVLALIAAQKDADERAEREKETG